jgi:hypothetical protein
LTTWKECFTFWFMPEGEQRSDRDRKVRRAIVADLRTRFHR